MRSCSQAPAVGIVTGRELRNTAEVGHRGERVQQPVAGQERFLVQPRGSRHPAGAGRGAAAPGRVAVRNRPRPARRPRPHRTVLGFPRPPFLRQGQAAVRRGQVRPVRHHGGRHQPRPGHRLVRRPVGRYRRRGRVRRPGDPPDGAGQDRPPVLRGAHRRGHVRAAGAGPARGTAPLAPPRRPVHLRDRGGPQPGGRADGGPAELPPPGLRGPPPVHPPVPLRLLFAAPVRRPDRGARPDGAHARRPGPDPGPGAGPDPARARPVPDDGDLGRGSGRPAQPPLPAHLPRPRGFPGAAPVPARRRGRPLPGAVHQRPAKLQPPADRGVPRTADLARPPPALSKYMKCLTTADLIPVEYRSSGIDQPLRSGLPNMIQAWESDEFVLDPSRVTIYIGATGIDGDHFKRSHLMDRYGVQINKTSRNTVLFMTTIGTTRSSVAYLIEVLVTIARELEDQISDMSPNEREAHERAVLRLTAPSAPLPDFSGFHASFSDTGEEKTPEGDVRRAFYLSYNDSYCEYLHPEEIDQRLENGGQVVSTTYVTPYPPGYPVLVPGQVFSPEILSFMRSLDTPEVHGYRPDLGYRVYT